MKPNQKYALTDFVSSTVSALIFFHSDTSALTSAFIFILLNQALIWRLNCYSYLLRFFNISAALNLLVRLSLSIFLATLVIELMFQQNMIFFPFWILIVLLFWRVIFASVRHFKSQRKDNVYIIPGIDEQDRSIYLYLSQKLDGHFYFLDVNRNWNGHKIYDRRIITEDELALFGSDIQILISRKYKPDIIKNPRFRSKWGNSFVYVESLFDDPRVTPFNNEMASLLEQLTGRKNNEVVDLEIIKKMVGSKVLVTGGAGSIGSELVRQLLKHEIDEVHILDASEFGIYKLKEEFGTSQSKLYFHLGDFRDDVMLTSIFSTGFDYVFHAAAYKHVPIIEGCPSAAYFNNYVGTKFLAEKCVKHKVSNMVLVSTDKAVRPTNIMGASKRLAELAVINTYHKSNFETKFSIVRFGNVMGSSGSVIPKFRELIANGGPVTVTHPEITRYFMTIPEAAKLVLKCHVFTTETPSLYVLDMGDQLKITDLAALMIDMFATSPVDITFTGLRPGEKMFEELVYDGELTPTLDKDILVQNIESLNIDYIENFLGLIDQHLTDRKFLDIENLLTDGLVNFKNSGK